jgi:2-oxoglutarate dehydrogenase E1 component
MLLPHGFEGAGPEHCSGRLERFLTLTAEHNIQIAIPTTAAQYFHLLRRQVKRRWRKPLIVFTPKSLLREPMLMSPLSDFCTGQFEKVVADDKYTVGSVPRRVILCTGKVGVDLRKLREERGFDDVSIVRIEQLYPLPKSEIESILSQYPKGTPVYWVQEEPRNMGAWYFMKIKWDEMGLASRWPLNVTCRPESASPSTGSKKAHKIEEQELFDEAFGEPYLVDEKPRRKTASA